MGYINPNHKGYFIAEANKIRNSVYKYLYQLDE